MSKDRETDKIGSIFITKRGAKKLPIATLKQQGFIIHKQPN